MDRERSLLEVVFAWRPMILRVTLAAIVIAGIVSLVLPSWHEASTVLMPPEETGTRGSVLKVFTQAGFDFGAGGLVSRTPETDLLIGIVKSRSLRGRIVDDYDLIDVYREDSRGKAIKELGEHLTVDTTPEGLVQISVDDRDAERAAGMANSLAELLDEHIRTTSVDQASRTVESLGDALESTQERLDESTERMRAFQVSHRTVELGEQTRVTVEAIAQLQAERTTLSMRRGVLEQFSTSDLVEMREVDARLTELDKRLDELTGTGQEADGVLVPLGGIPDLGIELMELTREVMIQEQVYEFLRAELEQARAEQVRDLRVITVLDRAVPPERRDRPRRKLIVLLTAMLAFVASIATALLADGFLSFAEREAAGARDSVKVPRLLVRHARWLRSWGATRAPDGEAD
jgi:tyrosine-protein kinase Etk/Wzc